MPLDVTVQQLDGRVERIVNAALVSIRDEGSHNVEGGLQGQGDPDLTTGDMVSSGVTVNTPEVFFPQQSKILVVLTQQISSLTRLQSALRKIM